MRADDTGGTSTAVWRLRIVAICVAMTALAFVQAPGVTVPDTKIDLSINPAGWLERALHLWTPAANFGELQNQAYGYLWPMGPFFLVGSWVGLPSWVIQRLWWAMLMCIAFTGTVRLAGRLGLGTPTARLIAGAAFALSPRILTQLGMQSVESWPTALAPWVLVPLIGLAKGAPLRRSVALSALVVACAGGVNATAVFAVVPLALLWLGTLQPMRYRLVAMGAWCLAVACATAWWLLPLLMLGSYSPPFLDYIENAEVTTRLTDIVTNMRGTSFWLAYLRTPYGPALPAGWRLATESVLVVATLVVAAFGLAGLSRRGTAHRRFLVTSLILGIGLLGLGHITPLDGGLGELGRTFLDGIGAPLRNVHKFDVLVRLPLALGIAAFLGLLQRAARGTKRRMTATAATLMATAAVVGVATPGLAGAIAPPSGIRDIPGYWHEAADWLDAHDGRDRVLVVPGAGFPQYRWGRTTDEVTQPLLGSSWAVRNAIPVTPPTTIRLLDAVESALASGAGSAGLADLLARSGIRYVLLRSDLDYGRTGTTRPVIARQALERSAGLTLAAGFGPTSSAVDGTADDGLDVPMQALEVFRVNRPVAQVVAYDASDVTTVVGGPESLLDLAAAGQLTAAPTILAGDLDSRAPPGPVALTDGLRRRDVGFGALLDNESATMTADERYPTSAPAHDYLPSWADRYATTARYDGIAAVTASSSWDRTNFLGGRRPEHQPYAALDGDPGTSWRSAPGLLAVGQWVEVTMSEPRAITEVTLRFDLTAPAVPAKITVAAGIEKKTVETFAETVTVELDGVHAARTVRVTIDSVFGGGTVGIAELAVPQVRAARTLIVPAAPATPSAIVLTAAPATPACFFVADQPRCSTTAARGSEDGTLIDRTVRLPANGSYAPAVWARPRPGLLLNALLDGRAQGAKVTASSTQVSDPVGRPGVVVDGDPATYWTPAAGDADPLLHLTWPSPREITGVRLTLAPGVVASRVGLIRVVGDGGIRGGFLDADGFVKLDPPMRTDEITILLLDSTATPSFDPYENITRRLPVAVGEVAVLPGQPTRTIDLGAPANLPCGSGPLLQAGGTTIPTRLVATVRDLLELREVPAEPCTANPRLNLAQGETRIVALASDLAVPTRVRLTADGQSAQPTSSTVQITSWSPTKRHVTIDAHPNDRVLAVRENTNPGWRASVAGQVLAPIVVDGWQQGWLVPAGVSGDVVLEFVPGTTYRIGLVLGAVLLLGVAILAALPARRRGAHAPTSSPAMGGTRQDRVLALVVGGLSMALVAGVLGAAIALAGGVAVAFSALPRTPGKRSRALRALESWLPVGLFGMAGWLWMVSGDPHHAAAPQLIGLLAVVSLWLSVAWYRTPVQAGSPSHDGELQEVVTQPGEDQTAGERQREGTQQVPRERLPILDGIDRFQDDQLPQEESIRHRS